MRPKSLDELVGQTSTKALLKIVIDSAKKRNTALQHILFTGSAGTGKTTLALAIANDYYQDEKKLKTKFTIVLGDMLKKTKDVLPYVANIKAHDMLFIDELHAVGSECAQFLYSILEDFTYTEYKKGVSIKKKVERFTLIGATTDPGQLLKPLKSRFPICRTLEQYTEEELVQIAHAIAKESSLEISGPIAKHIAKLGRGNPRRTVNLTNYIRDCLISSKTKQMNAKKLNEVLSLIGIDENGLETLDREYLTILQEEGCLSLRSLAAKLNTEPRNLEEVEAHLLKSGLIEITTKGRIINHSEYDQLLGR